MRVRIDLSRCVGCGLCEDTIPEVFSVGKYTASVQLDVVPEEMEESVLTTAQECPAEAIVVEE